MSGFIAIVNTDGAPIDRGLLEKLTASLDFKGPDRQQVWTDGSIGLGHTLFRTTNEAQYENQPASLDGEVWIIGSIRIDAREELVKKLGKAREIDLNRTPDSALILHAYRTWGRKCLDHLLGDFAFVLWDKLKKRLFCARDRFGMRQLCYAQMGSTLLVSNSLHCLLQHPMVTRDLSDQAMGDFLLFGDHAWLDKTVTAFSDIRVLPAAHQMTLCDRKLSIERYWDLPSDLPLLRYRREEDYVEHFNEVFESAVSDRIRIPEVVISMSGGMDSTAIAATLGKLQKKGAIQPVKVSTVTAVYDRIHPDKERYYTALAAEHLELPTCFLAGDDYTMLRPGVATTRPLEIETPAYWLDIKRQIAAYGRVVLTGASADNLMECSPLLATAREVNLARLLIDTLNMHRTYGRFPSMGTGLLAKLKGVKGGKNRLMSAFPYPAFLNTEFEHRMGLKDRWSEWLAWQPSKLNARHPGAHNSLIGPDWNTDDLCMDPDFTLAEERDPYLDLRLVEFIFSIPSTPWLFHKHILRRAMAQQLPEEIIKRSKTPLGDLSQSLMKEPANAWVNHWPQSTELSEYVEKKRLPEIMIEPWDGQAAYVNLRPLLLDTWMRQVA